MAGWNNGAIGKTKASVSALHLAYRDKVTTARFHKEQTKKHAQVSHPSEDGCPVV
jgi:hypothetical protein